MVPKKMRGGADPGTWIMIIGMIVILILSIVAGAMESKNARVYQEENAELLKKGFESGECECINPVDRGWRAFAAVFISLGVPFGLLMMIFGFSDAVPTAAAFLAGTSGPEVSQPKWIIIIIGWILIFIFSLIAGIVENKKGAAWAEENQETLAKMWESKTCECINPVDRGWRAFAAVFLSLGIPLFFLSLAFGFSTKGRSAVGLDQLSAAMVEAGQ